MKMKSHMAHISALSIAAIALWLVGGVGVANAQSHPFIKSGKEKYARYCAVCHGADAKGTGPFAYLLEKGAPDLTAISRKNREIFPFLTVINAVSGDASAVAHGGREMPSWAEAFREPGDSGSAHSQILDIALYLNSVQSR